MNSHLQKALVAEVGFEPHDLRVMSPTSYQAALLRDEYIHAECSYIIPYINNFVNSFYALFQKKIFYFFE